MLLKRLTINTRINKNNNGEDREGKVLEGAASRYLPPRYHLHHLGNLADNHPDLSCPPTLPSSSSRSAATRRRRTQRGGGSTSVWVLHVRCRVQQDRRQGALHLPQPRMDLPHQGTPPPYLSDEVGDNKIGAVGCSYLSQANMRGVKALYLGTFVEK